MSQISADTIKGVTAKNNITLGNTPIVSASANSLTIRGEGSNQTSIQQGLAKAWVSLMVLQIHCVEFSFNVSSVTDGEVQAYMNFHLLQIFHPQIILLFIVVGKVVEFTVIKCPHQNPTTSSHTVQLKNVKPVVIGTRNYICGAFHGDLS